jgi:hypothetical protein
MELRFLDLIVIVLYLAVTLAVGVYFARRQTSKAVESLDYHTVASRSLDGGRSWRLESPLIGQPPSQTTPLFRLTGNDPDSRSTNCHSTGCIQMPTGTA